MTVLKGIIIIALAVTTMVCFLGFEELSELTICIGFASGMACYMLWTKWNQDDIDERQGINKAAAEEKEYMQSHD